MNDSDDALPMPRSILLLHALAIWLAAYVLLLAAMATFRCLHFRRERRPQAASQVLMPLIIEDASFI